MLHLLLLTTPEPFTAVARRLAADEGLWTWARAMPTGDPAVVQAELAVGGATTALTWGEIRAAVAALVG